MKNSTLINLCVVTLILVFVSGCAVHSRRTITSTHWGGTDGPAMAKPAEGGQQGETAGPGAPASGKDMTLYVGYAEFTTASNAVTGSGPTTERSAVRICKLHEDNSLECSENKNLNKMLNPHLQK